MPVHPSGPAAPIAASVWRAALLRGSRHAFPHSPAARYISLAYAMQPGKQVYADSLSAVQRLLPLPWLRSGPLLAVHPQTAGTPGEQWVTCWFGLDHHGLQAVRPPTAFAGQHGLPSAPLPIGYELADVADARRVNDPSLPAGTALWIGLNSQPRWAGSGGHRSVPGCIAGACCCSVTAAPLGGPLVCVFHCLPIAPHAQSCCNPTSYALSAGVCTWWQQMRTMPRAGWTASCCCATCGALGGWEASRRRWLCDERTTRLPRPARRQYCRMWFHDWMHWHRLPSVHTV